MARHSYEDRRNRSEHPLLKKLFKIIAEKKTNLCVAANFETIEETLNFVDKVGRHICILKTQCERNGEVSEKNLKLLYEKKKKFNFLLFEDRKFNDGEETIKSIYKMYVKYVDLVTVSPNFGDPIFNAIRTAAGEAKLSIDEPRGCLAVCEYSFAGYTGADPKLLLNIARRNSDICVGIIAQSLHVDDDCTLVKLTPGVHLSRTSDGANQQWKHPAKVVANGADVIIVGRGIASAPSEELEQVACKYKEIAFKAYNEGCGTEFYQL